MASNHTEHFSLNQWLPDDQVKHTDFNADNAKIDAALGAMAPQLAMLARAVPNLAFYEGQEGIRRLLKGERHPAQNPVHHHRILRFCGILRHPPVRCGPYRSGQMAQPLSKSFHMDSRQNVAA